MIQPPDSWFLKPEWTVPLEKGVISDSPSFFFTAFPIKHGASSHRAKGILPFILPILTGLSEFVAFCCDV